MKTLLSSIGAIRPAIHVSRDGLLSASIRGHQCLPVPLLAILPLHRGKTTSPVIEENEAETFKGLASYWWDPHGSLCALHEMNRLRVPFIRDGLITSRQLATKLPVPPNASPLHGTRILDVGCGGGILSEPLAALGAEVTGVDEVPEVLQAAREHAALSLASSPNRFPGGTVPSYQMVNLSVVAKEQADSFDAVVLSEVLEHVTDWQAMLQTAANCVKPGGMLFVTTINRTLPSFFLGIVAAEYLAGMVPRGTHQWNKFIDPDCLTRSCLRTKLIPRQLIGMCYNPVTARWSWTSNLSINYAFSALKASTDGPADGDPTHTPT